MVNIVVWKFNAALLRQPRNMFFSDRKNIFHQIQFCISGLPYYLGRKWKVCFYPGWIIPFKSASLDKRSGFLVPVPSTFPRLSGFPREGLGCWLQALDLCLPTAPSLLSNEDWRIWICPASAVRWDATVSFGLLSYSVAPATGLNGPVICILV